MISIKPVLMSVFCLYIYCIGPAGECAGQQPSERAGGGEGAEEGEDPGRGGHSLHHQAPHQLPKG